MSGSFWFSPREECARREMGYEEGYAADVGPIPLGQLDEELCQLILGVSAPERGYSGLFDNMTDLLFMSLYRLGGSYVEHRHWVYIEQIFDDCIRKESNMEERRKLVLMKYLTHEWSQRRYRFYATG